jgi:hypothetical protein
VSTCADQKVFLRLAKTCFQLWPDSLYTNDIIKRLKAGPYPNLSSAICMAHRPSQSVYFPLALIQSSA